MKSIITIVCFLAFSTMLIGQFGISAKFQNNSNDQWNETYQAISGTNDNILSNSYEVGVNYWFRLKNKRVEFLPELTYASASDNDLTDVLEYSRTTFSFNSNIQIYPLDFEGDCNCPTFSKDGNSIKKGFYWLINPGVSVHNLGQVYNDPTSDPERQELDNDATTSFKMGIGAGLDIGLTDLLTISPFLLYNKDFGVDYETQTTPFPLVDVGDSSNSLTQWQLGVRLMFRPDYKN